MVQANFYLLFKRTQNLLSVAYLFIITVNFFKFFISLLILVFQVDLQKTNFSFSQQVIF